MKYTSALAVTKSELKTSDKWVKDNLLSPKTKGRPWSFLYDGAPSASFLMKWKRQVTRRKLDKNRAEITITLTDPKTGLMAQCVAVVYNDFPTVEWTLYFKNTGAFDTPILSEINALDTQFQRKAIPAPDPKAMTWSQICLDAQYKSLGTGDFLLHYHNGDNMTADNYEPRQVALRPKDSRQFAPTGGRPTTGAWPYFNLEFSGRSVIIVVAWPGQWAAKFIRDAGTGLQIQAGQELTHFKLGPGEAVRTPMIVLQFGKDDFIHSQNIWRRWMVAHNLPRTGGPGFSRRPANIPSERGQLPPAAFSACSSAQLIDMSNANEQNQKLFIGRYAENGIKLDYWWMDAGWYPCEGVGWPRTGTWEPDPKRFPKGLRPVTDYARAQGVKAILWFEPERVCPDTWLYEKHPEWLLDKKGSTSKLLNIGHPEALNWLIEHIDNQITKQGIDLYRQDFNFAPLDYWRTNDAPNRQGITEIRHIEGYLSFWDTLRRRHPKLIIDSCASGGRRNDLETMRRAIVQTRTDYDFWDPVGKQCQTYGSAFWLPYYGNILAPIEAIDSYSFRSSMSLSILMLFDVRRTDLDYALLAKLERQWRQVNQCYYGDYYPLTDYSLNSDVWMAWQFDRPDLGAGAIQIFRRAASAYESATFKLHGLIPDAVYRLTNLDTDAKIEMTGRELMAKGVPVVMKNHPDSYVISYQIIH